MRSVHQSPARRLYPVCLGPGPDKQKRTGRIRKYFITYSGRDDDERRKHNRDVLADQRRSTVVTDEARGAEACGKHRPGCFGQPRPYLLHTLPLLASSDVPWSLLKTSGWIIGYASARVARVMWGHAEAPALSELWHQPRLVRSLTTSIPNIHPLRPTFPHILEPPLVLRCSFLALQNIIQSLSNLKLGCCFY